MRAAWITKASLWLLYWGLSFCLWLLFVNTTHTHELWMSGIASAFAATAAEKVRTQPLIQFRPRLYWIAQVWREPWYILEGCASILWVFIKHWFRPEKSVLRQVVFDPGGSDPSSAARRALAIFYTTMPPNFVVLGIDPHKKAMLVHQVTETGTPLMTRNLGAKS